MDIPVRIVFKTFSQNFEESLSFYKANRPFPTRDISSFLNEEKTIICPLQANLSSLGELKYIK